MGKYGGGNGAGNDNKPISERALKKKLKRAVKTQNGFKTIMSVLAEDESKTETLINALITSTSTPTPASASTSSTTAVTPKFPNSVKFHATSLKVSSILNKKK